MKKRLTRNELSDVFRNNANSQKREGETLKLSDFIKGRNIEYETVLQYINKNVTIFNGHTENCEVEIELDNFAVEKLNKAFPIVAEEQHKECFLESGTKKHDRECDFRSVERRHGFKFRKSLGQNFLKDHSVVEEIINAADVDNEDLVIEIGPGSGALTQLLAEKARRVVAVEIDKEVIPILKEVIGERETVKIINGDILKIDLREIIENTEGNNPDFERIKIIGNLPYYITTPIIMKILRERIPAKSITCMVQKEVADRINGKVGSKEYGALSIAVRYFCNVTKICDVPGYMFVPVPKVDSAVIRLDIKQEQSVKIINQDIFFSLVKTSFSKRRKTLQNAMTGYRGMDKNRVGEILKKAEVNPAARGETLDPDTFAKIANVISEME